MEGELFQGGVLMHSYLRAVGFSRITKRSSIRQIITDVVETYDEKTVIENYPDGMFAEFSKNYGCDCGITVCGQYDENNVFYPDYYFPFFRGTGITTQESVVIERHADKESFAGACDDLRIGVTLIFYLQNAAEYLQQREKGNILPGGQPLTLSGLAREGKILFPVEKDKEAVKAERELTKNRNHLIAAARIIRVDYAVKKDRSSSPPKYLIFFKGRDADALTAAFTEYTNKKVKKATKTDRPSVLEKLNQFKEMVKNAVVDRTKRKELER